MDKSQFRMDGLHICFNFPKSIGQHMDRAGLDGLWTETGVYVANTTQTMLDGKVYYRAVRGHPLTYEALATQVANIQVIHQAHSDNPNFKMWSTYISMIEILLDFIRAERSGNWMQHVEAFTAMLPWFTIYDHTNYARWGPVYLADMKLIEKTTKGPCRVSWWKLCSEEDQNAF